MTPDPFSSDSVDDERIDSLARQSRAAFHGAAAALPRRRVRKVRGSSVAVAALVVLATVSVSLAVTRRGESATDVVTTPTTTTLQARASLPPIPSWVPAGLEPALPTDDGEGCTLFSELVGLSIYGPSTDDWRDGRANLPMVAFEVRPTSSMTKSTDPADIPPADKRPVPVMVGATPGSLTSSAGSMTLAWAFDESHDAIATSRGLSAEELTVLAASAQLDGNHLSVDPSSIGGGAVLLAFRDQASLANLAFGFSLTASYCRSSTGDSPLAVPTVLYKPSAAPQEGASDRFLSVATATDAALVVAIARLISTDSKPLLINGRPVAVMTSVSSRIGVAGDQPRTSIFAVMADSRWGAVVVFSGNLTMNEVTHVLESVEPTDPVSLQPAIGVAAVFSEVRSQYEDVRDLQVLYSRSQGSGTQLVVTAKVKFAERTGPAVPGDLDGVRDFVLLQVASVDHGQPGSRTSGAVDPSEPGRLHRDGSLVYGVVPPGSQRVVLRSDNKPDVAAVPLNVTGDWAYRFFAVEGDFGQGLTATALAADGQELLTLKPYDLVGPVTAPPTTR